MQSSESSNNSYVMPMRQIYKSSPEKDQNTVAEWVANTPDEEQGSSKRVAGSIPAAV